MDKIRIIAASRKALIAASPEYYSWPEDQQETYRANITESDAWATAETILLAEITGAACTQDEISKISDELTPAQVDDYNWAKLLITGIGDDTVYLNEIMGKNTTLLDFDTLYDYDHNDHLYQEKANQKEDNNYPGRDYYAFRFSLWLRLIIQQRFYYATIYSLADYIKEEIQQLGQQTIDRLIPNEFVEGKDNGKAEKGGFLWDMKCEAGGLEPQLDELETRWIKYQQQLWIELSEEFKQDNPGVFIEEVHIGNVYIEKELNRNFIFSNETTLKRIRWKHFLSDCELIKLDFSDVEARIKQETEKASQYLEQQHIDIMENFDPNVLKFKKKRKVIIAPGALDG